MNPETPQQQIEVFHLIFLRQLGERIDKSFYVLKGGCNLRFYFKSIRYSEDIDLDVKTIAKDTLRTQVTKLLQSPALGRILQSRKMYISDIHSPKQTDTTQRWKLKIEGPGVSIPVPTKIEFSRRGLSEDFVYEPVDMSLITSYSLYPILCNHYTRESAYIQKVRALLNRTETQARDLFDLNLLLDSGLKADCLPLELKSRLEQAMENTVSISYPAYQAQVVAYLSPEYQKYFGTPAKWHQIQEKLLKVFDTLWKERGRAP